MMRYYKEHPGSWGSIQQREHIVADSRCISMRDNCELFVRSWRVESDDILLVLHGLGGHSGWYIDVGNELAAHNMNVYIMDHRGFGRSTGHPGHVDTYHIYIEDILEIVQYIQQHHPHGRLYLLGHSMGGIFAAHFAAKYQHLLHGLIFLNPWIADTAKVPFTNVLQIFLGGLFKSKRLWVVGNGHKGMTENEEAIQMLLEDTFWRRQLTATFLVQILFMRIAVLSIARRITISTLVLQAENDKVVSPAASKRLYTVIPSKDKMWFSYPHFAHDTQFEQERAMLDDDLVQWITTRSGSNN